MIAIIDYGVGNLFSLEHSLLAVGAQPVVTGDAQAILAADRVILPGVGAFGDAAKKLRETKLDAVIREAAARGTPVMGICLGMQLLLDRSFEFGVHEGLGLIRGEVRPISGVIPTGLKIPHIGWNELRVRMRPRYAEIKGLPLKNNPLLPHPIFKYVRSGDCVYFVHSFYGADCDDAVIADTEYGAPLTAAVAKGNVCGCQFHPEKSGGVGLSILQAFCEWEGRE